MKMKTVVLLACTMLLTACSMYTPQNYVGRTTLNANKFRDFGSRKIKSLIKQRDNDMLFKFDGDTMEKTESVEEHVNTLLLTDISNDIEKIKELKVTDDAEEMIAQSLELFNFVKQAYRTDYVVIAKLIDNDGNSNEIEALMKRLDDEKLPKIMALHDKLLDATVAYAEANGVDFKRL